MRFQFQKHAMTEHSRRVRFKQNCTLCIQAPLNQVNQFRHAKCSSLREVKHTQVMDARAASPVQLPYLNTQTLEESQAKRPPLPQPPRQEQQGLHDAWPSIQMLTISSRAPCGRCSHTQRGSRLLRGGGLQQEPLLPLGLLHGATRRGQLRAQSDSSMSATPGSRCLRPGGVGAPGLPARLLAAPTPRQSPSLAPPPRRERLVRPEFG